MDKIPESSSGEIVVQVSNLVKGKGSINVALYNNEDDFTDVPYKTQIQSIQVGQSGASVTFTDIKPGTYAIALYQDVNGNGKIDTNFFGIPKEPYGFSNNYRPTVTSPSFEKSKFTVSKGKVVQRIKVG